MLNLILHLNICKLCPPPPLNYKVPTCKILWRANVHAVSAPDQYFKSNVMKSVIDSVYFPACV